MREFYGSIENEENTKQESYQLYEIKCIQLKFGFIFRRTTNS